MADQAPRNADDSNQRPAEVRRPTIRSQLLVAVNLVLAVLVVLFLIYDYRRDLAERLDNKRIALEEEAKTLLPAVSQLRHNGPDDVQQYLDAVCGRMQDAQSPGHHIAVELRQETFQALAHHRASPEMLQAMQRAASSDSHLAQLGPTELVVGAVRQGDTAVYVSESMENLHQSVIGDVLRRLAGFVALAVVAAGVVNLVLTCIVTRPLRQLVATVRRIGSGQLGIQSCPFRAAELNYLAGELNAMSTSLAAADRDRRSQMARARRIQRNLLPRGVRAPGLKTAALFDPAEEVGGDYYDILPLSDGSWLFCVADVTGHGVPAAMSAAMLKVLLVQATQSLTSPSELLSFIDRHFAAVNSAGDLITMVLVRMAADAGALQYASAGHEPAWMICSQGARELASTGLPLGVTEEAVWDDVCLRLAEGDRVFLVTDGISETLDATAQMYGRQRLARFLEQSRTLPLEQMPSFIRESLAAYRGDAPQFDDMTLVLIEVDGDADPENAFRSPAGHGA